MGNARLLTAYTGPPGNQSGGGGSFTPLQHFSIDAVGTLGNQILVPGGPSGGSQFYTIASGGFGGIVNNAAGGAPVRPGKSTSLQIAIQAAETGDTGPGIPGWGLYPPATFGPRYGDVGQWFHYGLYRYIPSTWQCTTNIQENALKEYLYVYVDSNSPDIYGKYDVHMTPTGYVFVSEFDPNNNLNNSYPSQRSGTNTNWPTNVWFWEERGVFLSTNGNTTIERVWINNTLVLEQNGTNITWQNSDGSYHTYNTGAAVGSPSVPSGVLGLYYIDYMGYWNGGAPQNQSWYADDIVTHNGQAGMVADNRGNLHIPYTNY